ncbi:hypothetical protein GYMLUDRAFT_48512 [Collybiopsis luxurians FD-317 M1]|uniref:Unplaced genomic scaffold GYMLUscaffold_66, whole genome shotgun sequence n=1 Tax=Collybiopsis luxurians FD-317 M1 TaxID=944289 RepID=A0A0D0CI31_9AGAR|nr:hypothetical protein GYMLUDRAFT_48512 [Collybiopsis luxurians FD-317 M1]
MSDSFPALPGFYKLLFLYFEPVSTISPALLIWLWPGASWFHHQLVPTPDVLASRSLDARTVLAVWQLGNCYMLLGLISSLVFRAVRDALRNDVVAQERILGSALTALAIADVTHVLASLVGLPPELRFSPASWNATTHGNITFTMFLFSVRLAWFLGVGRRRYYYGQPRLTQNKTK